MKFENVNFTVVVLGVITIFDIMFSKEIGGSFGLWFLYGLYKLLTTD
jgi:hypothetical protein